MAQSSESGRFKRPWRREEDELLRKAVEKDGPRKWSLISKSVPGRSGKSCRNRWFDKLSPQVEHRAFTPGEDETIVEAHARLGNKWSTIARMLPGRTDNAVKNRWNGTLRKRFSMCEEFNNFDREAHPPPKRSAGVGPGTYVSSPGFCFRPTGSEPGHSAHPRPVPRTGGISAPHTQPEPVTWLSLSLPGSDLISKTAPDTRPQLDLNLPMHPVSSTPANPPEKQFLSAGLLGVMQEMVRKEVRNYM